MAKRRCKGETANGDCRTYAIQGSDFCIAHSPKEVQEKAGFGGPQPGAGRPKNPRAVDVLRQKLEEDVDRVLEPLWEALAADTHTMVGSGEDAYAEILPDHKTRIVAVREILDRAYGRPKQATEVTGADGGPVTVVDLGDEKTRDLVGELLRRRPATRDE